MTEKTLRYDYYEFFDGDEKKLERTAEGYLTGRAVVTNVGVFPYLQEDGTVSYELRPPEEVFKQSSMDSLRGKPVTNEHPTEAVTPENFKELAVGSIGDGISRDEYHLIAPITVNETAAVGDVEAGKRALSCGYRTRRVQHDVTYTDGWTGKKKTYQCPGVWMGVYYDTIQTDIEYNHVALVSRGRAGDAAVLRMDGAMITDHQPKKEMPMSTKKLRLDNELEYEVPQEVKVAYDAATKKVDDLTAQLAADKAAAERAQSEIKAQLDDAKEKLAEAKKTIDEFPTRVDAAVKNRLQLRDVATKAGVTLKGDESDRDVKVAVIKAMRPHTAATLAKADEAYIDGRFNIVCEDMDAGVSPSTNPVTQDGPKPGAKPAVTTDAAVDDAKKAYHDSLRKEK